MAELFFARKAGVTISHNLTPDEVFDIRLGDGDGMITILRQQGYHAHLGRPAFCPECAEAAAEVEESEKRRFWQEMGQQV